MKRNRTFLVLGLALLQLGVFRLDEVGAALVPGGEERPNFVVILTDDQRWDSLFAMPYVNRKLRKRSVDFRNAYVTSPVCCPVRASFLSGGFYAHNTGVLTNSAPNGGATKFDDTESLPLQLLEAGYRTGLVGKYMNEYHLLAPWIPPGWSRFVGSVTSDDWLNYEVAIGSSGRKGNFGRKMRLRGRHLMEFEVEEVLEFLDDSSDEPFFLLWSANAPHEPATPASGDEDLFPGYKYRERSWGEKDLADKPRFVRRRAADFNAKKRERDQFHADQLRSLAVVDRGVKAILELLERKGQLESTIIIFTSDNGYLWGEHRLETKNLPYEESIRVPLLVSRPGTPAGTDDRLVAMNLDVPATILDLAGIYRNAKRLARHTDGSSLRPLLDPAVADKPEWRQELLIEGFSRIFAGLLSRQSVAGETAAPEAAWLCKYVETGGSSMEFYRSDSDPFEMESLHRTPEFRRNERPVLSSRLAEVRGLAITTERLPPGELRVKYKNQLKAVGRSEPYVWTIESGELPEGLRINSKGKFRGRPKESGVFTFSVRVDGSTLARYTGLPQSYISAFELTIAP